MVQFLSIFFFFGFLQFLLGFSKVPVFLCHPVQNVLANKDNFTVHITDTLRLVIKCREFLD